jgi:hypothetical protein
MRQVEISTETANRRDYTAVALEALYKQIDQMHDDAANGQLYATTDISRADLQGWIEELIYTLRETLLEVNKTEG